MSRIGLKFSEMILHTSTSKMMNNLPFILVVLHKPTLWPSTFKPNELYFHENKLTRQYREGPTRLQDRTVNTRGRPIGLVDNAQIYRSRLVYRTLVLFWEK